MKDRDDFTVHPYRAAHGIPYFVLRLISLYLHIRPELASDRYTDKEIHAYNDYYVMMVMN